MFKAQSVPVVAAVEPASVVPVPADSIPLSHLELDVPAPPVGWVAYLEGRGISVVADDIGRLSIGRADARQLLDEQREHEVRRREAVERNERRAIEADRQYRARLWGGMPVAEGLTGTEALLVAAAADNPPRRVSPVEEALTGDGVTYHRWPSEE